MAPRLPGLSILEAGVGRCGLVILGLSNPGAGGRATEGVAGVAGGEVVLVRSCFRRACRLVFEPF